MKSLAEFLGTTVAPPAAPEGSTTQAPLEATLFPITDGKELGLAVINSIEFKKYIVNGLELGNLPGFASILGRLMDHALGKPADVLEVKDVTVPPEELTAAQLEERASRLMEMALYMRRAEQFDEPVATDSVH